MSVWVARVRWPIHGLRNIEDPHDARMTEQNTSQEKRKQRRKRARIELDSRLRVVDLPGYVERSTFFVGGEERKRWKRMHTGFRLSEKQYSDDSPLLVHLTLEPNSVVDTLRHLSCLLLSPRP